jgi:hypothetical protein
LSMPSKPAKAPLDVHRVRSTPVPAYSRPSRNSWIVRRYRNSHAPNTMPHPAREGARSAAPRICLRVLIVLTHTVREHDSGPSVKWPFSDVINIANQHRSADVSSRRLAVVRSLLCGACVGRTAIGMFERSGRAAAIGEGRSYWRHVRHQSRAQENLAQPARSSRGNLRE